MKHRAWRYALDPNDAQRSSLAPHCGVSLLAAGASPSQPPVTMATGEPLQDAHRAGERSG